jgi:hypothetical protein
MPLIYVQDLLQRILMTFLCRICKRAIRNGVVMILCISCLKSRFLAKKIIENAATDKWADPSSRAV